MAVAGIHTKSISFIGAGNMAWHLGTAFSKKGVQIKQIIARNKLEGELLAKQLHASYTASFKEIDANVDLIIIAVSDSAIKTVVSQLRPGKAIIVHTSGSVSMDVLAGIHSKVGVFYPLQTFSKKVKTGKLTFPVCIEASDKRVLDVLAKYAALVSGSVTELDSEQRRQLHLGAIMVNNFTNHLLTRASDFLKEHSIPEDLLIPILEETVRKAMEEGSRETQTGPAMRGDSEILKKHLALLHNFPEMSDIYKVMSASIEAYYSKD